MERKRKEDFEPCQCSESKRGRKVQTTAERHFFGAEQVEANEGRRIVILIKYMTID
jgi:hypothetical protein